MQLLLLTLQDCTRLREYIDNGNYLSHNIINEMITSMNDSILRELSAEITEAEIFSLIADEATDVCYKEQLCITIRFVNQLFEIYKTPVELISLKWIQTPLPAYQRLFNASRPHWSVSSPNL